MVGLNSYDVPRKEAWRGWQWNQIVAHLPEFHGKQVPAKGSAADRAVTSTKTVVFLMGPDHTKDLQCAVNRGFRPENLIGVDFDQAKVDRARSLGQNCICGELAAVIAAWSPTWKLDVIVADFCGGFGRSSCEFMATLTTCQALAKWGVIAINMLRGRDAISSEARSYWSKKTSPEFAHLKLHRAYLWLLQAATFTSPLRHAKSNYDMHDALGHIWTIAQPKFNSYKSSNGNSHNVLDSAVFNWFGIPTGGFDFDRASSEFANKVNRMTKCVAAARAVRTARLKAAMLTP